MRPVSATFLAAVRGSHAMVSRARVCTTYQEGTAPTGTDIPILAGDVQLDGTADVRSTLDLTTSPLLWPTQASSLLAPFGNEIFVERGIKIGGNVTEWVSLGYFRIQEPEQDEAPRGEIRVTGRDRMAGIVDGRLTDPRQYPSTATYGAVVTELVHDIYPTATIVWDDATDTSTLNRSVIAEEDRYAFLNDLITAVGKVWYWDYRGRLIIKNPPDPSSPVYDVSAGANGVLISLGQRLSRDGVYNGVVASGEAADTTAPARGVAVDSNPNSPTYWGGRFGKVPRFYSSPLLTTNAQAANAAQALLKATIGLPYSVDFTTVPNPALEPYDPIRVFYSDQAATRTHVIEKLTVPLMSTDSMKGSTREQTLVIIGGVV